MMVRTQAGGRAVADFRVERPWMQAVIPQPASPLA